MCPHCVMMVLTAIPLLYGVVRMCQIGWLLKTKKTEELCDCGCKHDHH